MTTAGKVFLIVLAVLVAIVGIFCGLYFGLPAFHDWFVGLFKAENAEAVEQGTKAIASLIIH